MRRRPGGPAAGKRAAVPGACAAAGWGLLGSRPPGLSVSAPLGPVAPGKAGIGFVVLGLLGLRCGACFLV